MAVKILDNLYVLSDFLLDTKEFFNFKKLSDEDKIKSLILRLPSVRIINDARDKPCYYPALGNFLVSSNNKLMEFKNCPCAEETAKLFYKKVCNTYSEMNSSAKILASFAK